ncbi:phosphoribosyltransferase family protein [Patiriisocius hiemis]|uniref:Phosphoribosyltransferase family protein n=1 Tax=Patiriisocius hiemis TaxID=3075604 RepID=A0ABU2YC06_9FLAO|nr:phosphoribosyltransferase family protein [Constantimarinum sp. W242]MDT0555725.1 phosphoribosyltransferase family protein [Constantimarinum sp. W242]
MSTTSAVILDKKQIVHKIKRIAYQVYEANVSEKEIVIAGIKENGFILAKKIKTEVEKISPIKVTLCELTINKKKPTDPITTSLGVSDYKNKSLLLVDDVLHSGTTLIYGVKHFLEVPLKQFKTAVLVDRNHKKYPVKADYKGISLSTSLNENVVVVFDKGKDCAFLE